ncbi:MAG: hypothetical protein ACE5WD_13205 [Candidatus Aminicenantia bacterium]
MITLIEKTKGPYENKLLKLMSIRQKELEKDTKWNLYLRATPIYYKIINNKSIIKLESISTVIRGFTTGANEFFLLDKRKVKSWGLKSKYLKSALSSPRDIKKISFDKNDVKEYMFVCHKPKKEIKSKNVLKYIEAGEEKRYNKRPTVSNRKLWYDLGKREQAPILLPRLSWERFMFVWNKVKCIPNNIFYEITPKNKKDIVVLLGILNSSFSTLIAELNGRSYGGGVLEIAVYELKKFPIPNPSKLTSKERKNIENSFLALVDAQNKGNKKAEEKARKDLDNAVFDILGLTRKEREEIYKALEEAKGIRVKRREKEVLVK